MVSLSGKDSCLKKRRQLPSSSHLLSLHPVLDAHGLGGRREHSSLSYSRRHPVILPGSHADLLTSIFFENGEILICLA